MCILIPGHAPTVNLFAVNVLIDNNRVRFQFEWSRNWTPVLQHVVVDANVLASSPEPDNHNCRYSSISSSIFFHRFGLLAMQRG